MKWLDRLEEYLIATFMGAATLIIFMSVMHRYLVGIHSPIQDWLLTLNVSWAQEATIYLFVWMAKFGAAYGVRTGIHVGVDVLINQLSEVWPDGRRLVHGRRCHHGCRLCVGERRALRFLQGGRHGHHPIDRRPHHA